MSNHEAILEGIVERVCPDNMFGGKPLDFNEHVFDLLSELVAEYSHSLISPEERKVIPTALVRAKAFVQKVNSMRRIYE